ncbi:integration host factor [Rhodococcus hoagii]|nr:integration host factor [Prescottella equi]NKS72230.1 integration host factor [Prescottella equi]
MALPTLSPEQRAQALEKAVASRNARSALREDLKSGAITFEDALNRAETDEIIGRTRVLYALESLPKIGKVRAREIINELGIAESRRLRGLGARQRADLIERLA